MGQNEYHTIFSIRARSDAFPLRGQGAPDFEGYIQKLQAVGVVKQHDEFTMIPDSLNHGLKSENRAAVYASRALADTESRSLPRPCRR